VVYCKHTRVRVPKFLGIICSGKFCEVSSTVVCEYYVRFVREYVLFICKYILWLAYEKCFFLLYRNPGSNLAANLFVVAIIAVLEFRMKLVLDYFNVIDIKGPRLCGVQPFLKSK